MLNRTVPKTSKKNKCQVPFPFFTDIITRHNQ